MKKIILIQLFLLGTVQGMRAQDFHLSQIDAAPHYFNPALTGIYFGEEADYRIYSDYRSQWRSLGMKPYSTFYMGYDMAFKEQYGLGGYLISNRNGAGGMNTIQVMPSGAYRITKDKNGEHQLAAGLQLGIIYNSIDPDRYTYEKQFTPDGPAVFDQNVWNGEYFVKQSILKPDASLGTFYKYKRADWKAHPLVGLSIFHATRPNRSFTTLEKDKLPMRWVYQLGADWKVNEQVDIKPMIMYMQMAKAHELNFGATGSYLLKDSKSSILGGLNYRTQDAFIIQLGMKYDRHIFMFSYDINTSYLSNYTHTKGAFEFTIRLTGIKGRPLFNPRFK